MPSPGFLDSLGGTQDRLESATRKSIVVFTVSLQNIIASLACPGLLGPDTPLADSAPPSAVFLMLPAQGRKTRRHFGACISFPLPALNLIVTCWRTMAVPDGQSFACRSDNIH